MDPKNSGEQLVPKSIISQTHKKEQITSKVRMSPASWLKTTLLGTSQEALVHLELTILILEALLALSWHFASWTRVFRFKLFRYRWPRPS